jgi:mycoredoxin
MRIVNLVVYSASWCRDCREAKRFLESHNIPFAEIDIEETPGAAEEVFAHAGKYAIPQFVIDGEWVQPYRPGRGFLYAEMKARLGIGAAQASGGVETTAQSGSRTR